MSGRDPDRADTSGADEQVERGDLQPGDEECMTKAETSGGSEAAADEQGLGKSSADQRRFPFDA